MSMVLNIPSHLSVKRQVAYLYSSGLDDEQIADTLEITLSEVTTHIKNLAQLSIDDHRANIIRQSELVKLEELERGHYEAATIGVTIVDSEGVPYDQPPSIEHGEFILKVMDRRIKLTGIEIKPSQDFNVTHQGTLVGILAQMNLQEETPRQPPKLKVIEHDKND